MKSQPFRRLNVMLEVAKALCINYGMSWKDALLYQGPYISRGKGRSIMNKAPVHKHMSMVRAARKQRNIAKRK
jgi:hypothetical protein